MASFTITSTAVLQSCVYTFSFYFLVNWIYNTNAHFFQTSAGHLAQSARCREAVFFLPVSSAGQLHRVRPHEFRRPEVSAKSKITRNSKPLDRRASGSILTVDAAKERK